MVNPSSFSTIDISKVDCLETASIAFLIDNELVEPTALAKQYVYETWDIFLAALEVKEDLGWESLEELFHYVDKKDKK